MRFLWPEMLWLLLAAPALVGVYILLLRRKNKAAVTYSSLSLIRQAMRPSDLFRRHVPPFLLLLAMIMTVIAMARPTAVVTLPSQQQTIVLAMDVSLSMIATDVDPNRITAAQEAAKTFVEERPPDARIAIVAFGGAAAVVQPPTQSRDDLLAAIDRFQLQRGTATGSALYVALATLLPDAGVSRPLSRVMSGVMRYEMRWEMLPVMLIYARATSKEFLLTVLPSTSVIFGSV